MTFKSRAAFAAVSVVVFAVHATIAVAEHKAADPRMGLSASKTTLTATATIDSHGSNVKETAPGDMIADAMRDAAGVDMAFVPAAEIVDLQIPAGPTNANEMLKFLRYKDDPSDTIDILTLSFSQILNASERSVQRLPQPFDGFLQISGLQLQYDAKAPVGKRITIAGTSGAELTDNRTYRVAMPQSLADGDFGYFTVWQSDQITGRTGVSLATALSKYLIKHSSISGTPDKRISAQ